MFTFPWNQLDTFFFPCTTKYVFVFILPTLSLPWFFLLFLLNLKKKHFISLIRTKFMLWIPFKKITKTVIKFVENQIFKNVYLPRKPALYSCFSFFFTCTTQNKSRTTKYIAVEQRQDQHQVRHVWSIGVISSVLREIQMWTHLT